MTKFDVCYQCGKDYACEKKVYIGSDLGNDYFFVCYDCYIKHFLRCACCGKSYKKRNMVKKGKLVYCKKCIPLIRECNHCNEVFFSENYYKYCTNCDNSNIKTYSYKPFLRFLKSSKEESESLFIGFELEVVDKNGGNAILNTMLNNDFERRLHCMFDGSVSNGAELVSLPFTLKYWKGTFNSTMYNILKELRIKGCKSFNTTSCGMHIHINRKFFTDLEVYKLQNIIYSHKSFIRKIAQRPFNRWSKSVQKKSQIEFSKKFNRNYDRYIAVNLANKGTVELRLFKGNLKFSSFEKNIEFAFALANFVKFASLKDCTLTNFKRYIKANAFIYQSLYGITKRKNSKN